MSDKSNIQSICQVHFYCVLSTGLSFVKSPISICLVLLVCWTTQLKFGGLR